MLSTLVQASQCVLRQAVKKAFPPSSVLPVVASSRSFTTSFAARVLPPPPNWAKQLGNGRSRSLRSLPTVQQPIIEKEDPTWNALAPMIKAIQDADRMQRNPEEIWRAREKYEVPFLPQPQGPYAGRTVHVKPTEKGNDFSSAFIHLNRILQNNRVRRELRVQARHEKPGVKRRRLASERWRKRFAHEVRLKVRLVQQIRARGA